MIQFVQFCWMCLRAYRHPGDLQYFSLSRYGVPTTVVLIGRNREAWEVCNYMARYCNRNVAPLGIRKIL